MGQHRLGYACINTTQKWTTNQTCRLAAATPEKLAQVTRANLVAMTAILAWNVPRHIGMFRIGSGFVPFASHPEVHYDWRPEFTDPLAELGRWATDNGVRLSMHPGQYTIINSPNPKVVSTSIVELQYSADLLDALQCGGDAKIILHVGGVYGDRDAALRRFIESYRTLSDSIRARLVLEHDDKLFTLDDVLRVHDETGIPIIFDNLHHALNPGDIPLESPINTLLQRAFATWNPLRDGRPKIHFATQKPEGLPGAHSDHVDMAQFKAFLDASGDLDYDLMFECKDKELSALDAIELLDAENFAGTEYTAPSLALLGR